jgi:excisionase family DNA binding protein
MPAGDLPEHAASASASSSAALAEVRRVSVAEAARQLGLDRSRIYALVRAGELEAHTDPHAGLRIAAASLERRRALGEIAGSPLSAANAWLLIALASGDPCSRHGLRTRSAQP